MENVTLYKVTVSDLTISSQGRLSYLCRQMERKLWEPSTRQVTQNSDIYAYTYIYIYIYTHTTIHIHTNIFILYVYAYIYMYHYIYRSIHVCIYRCTHICVYIYIYLFIQIMDVLIYLIRHSSPQFTRKLPFDAAEASSRLVLRSMRA